MSYITPDEADVYASELLNDPWTAQTTDRKTRALAEATNGMNQLNFRGAPTPGQINAFPRLGSTLIPDAIKRACFHWANALIQGIDPEKEYLNLTLRQNDLAFGKTVFRDARLEHILAGVPSVTAWRYLLPFLRDSRTVDIRRTS